MEIADLTPAERRVWWAFPRGEIVDFRAGPGEDAEHGDTWGPERTVRAEVLRALMISGSAAAGEIAGLKVKGARVPGLLDLQHGAVAHAVWLTGCHFERAPLMYAAECRQLVLSGSYLPGLDADALHTSGVLRLTGCVVPGPIRLGGSTISQTLFVDGARLGDEDEDQEPVLQLNQATIGNDLWGAELVAHGQVRLSGATIGGSVNLYEAELSAPGGTALLADTLTVGADLRAMRASVTGRLELRGARVPGQLNLTSARLSNPGGMALRASGCVVSELWLREAAPIEGTVNLRRARLDLLHATPEVWPADVKLDGLTYGSLVPQLPAAQRLDLLERDGEGFLPYSYEQLSAAYRRIGDEGSARTVQLAKERRHRGTLPWYARIWGYLQDAAVGYGFRPTRAAGWLFALLLTGAAAYGLHPPPPLKPGEVPDFNALFYTFDLLLPIIDFGQEKAFKPSGGYQWLAYVLVLAGWVLATTIVAGITRAVSRQ